MTDFTHFTNYAEFGYVKQANKQLKKLHELKSGGSKPLGNLSESVANSELKNVSAGEAKSYLDSRVRGNRYGRTNDSNSLGVNGNNFEGSSNTLLRGQNRVENASPKERKPRSYENNEFDFPRKDAVRPNAKDFTDIRKVDDYAASPTGYLGFRIDPYKGYGGMMEEPVNMIKTGSKTPKARIPY